MARTAPSSTGVGKEPDPTLGTAGPVGFLGTMFLMATSAIGPGFPTQTTMFTIDLRTAFAFAVLVTVVVDVAIQLTGWRIGVSGRRAQDPANAALPGAGLGPGLLDGQEAPFGLDPW